jgi:HSP20 family molecular chaperone IbpA
MAEAVMQPQLIESMRDQVRTIYRVATGTDMPELQASGAEPEAPLEEVTRSFAELEALTRTIPALAERISPFSFTPALDALVEGNELVVEAAVPGVDQEDIEVACVDGMLVISGIRRGHAAVNAASYSHSEIPHGPFSRTFHLPFAIAGEPAVDLDRGLLRIRLQRPSESHQQEETSEHHSH